jgi:hypothetical protein
MRSKILTGTDRFCMFLWTDYNCGRLEGGLMNTSWQTANPGIAPRWADPDVEAHYDLSWMEEMEDEIVTTAAEAVQDFATHSPLGSGEWFAPWNARWSLPGRLKI